ncbi:type II toxin-antitoxin system HicB family antitoxin [Limosilactobacillus sp.]|jgi:predicted RNase H-like HicB family nuclease|uniref:type II toxin-antitoxin system HicB family antitoxin n=1 Tax=Limosilactobacillus sp. TaxID=2773925 RepID=UPI0025C27E56|nr:type II toxin-antitoxin system HicB family antitoxin [Limosilactobacillus sp.]MCI2031672.1 type II toxin-antitoxin system HicB family antitoxin [Limosilactobacillus sp.]
MDEIRVFPIIITKDKGSNEYPYFVEIPYIDGMTEGKSIADAMEMAKDYIGTFSLENDLPESNTKLPKVKEEVVVTLVTVNVSEYKRKHDNRAVKKIITIPNYLNELGKENGINFSEIMTAALKKKLRA